LVLPSWFYLPGTIHFILRTFLHPAILFFSTHAHTIAICFAVVPRLSSIPSLSLEFKRAFASTKALDNSSVISAFPTMAEIVHFVAFIITSKTPKM